MQSDAMRGHARAELRLWCTWAVLACAWDLSGCSAKGSDTGGKAHMDQPNVAHAAGASADGPKIGIGGTGTVSETGSNMIVSTLPGGRSAVSIPGTAGTAAAAPSVGTAGAGLPASGSAGVPGAMTPAAAGGAAPSAGSGGPSMSMSYPPLDAAAIGMPTQIAMGFTLAESPLWDPCTDRLMFTDVTAAGGGVINALGADGMVTEIMKGTMSTNGIAWDIDGSLLLAQMDGGLARRSPAGMVTPIDHGSLRLHTPDDVVVRSDGTIYLSDGNFCPAGALLGYNDTLPVYVIKPGVAAWTNGGTVKGPNGIELSPDEKFLYLNGFGEGAVYKFDVMPDGSIKKPEKPLVTGLSDPDSLCLDAGGNLYVAVATGIQVLRPDGTKVKLIPISGRTGACTKAGMTNCTFGGADGKTLYITGWQQIWKVENMPIPGLDWLVGKQRAKCN